MLFYMNLLVINFCKLWNIFSSPLFQLIPECWRWNSDDLRNLFKNIFQKMADFWRIFLRPILFLQYWAFSKFSINILMSFWRILEHRFIWLSWCHRWFKMLLLNVTLLSHFRFNNIVFSVFRILRCNKNVTFYSS